MARLLLEVRRWALVVSCAPLVMLAGCPQEKGAAPGKAPAQATAPAIAGGPSGGSTGQSNKVVVPPAQAADAAAKAAKVQQLINKAEAAYRSGVGNYRAGHLEWARQEFGSAVGFMLSTGMEL